MSAMTSKITGVSIVCSTVSSGTDQRKHQSSAPLAFVRRIHRSPLNSPHKSSATRNMFPFDDVIMNGFTPLVTNNVEVKFGIYIIFCRLFMQKWRKSRSLPNHRPKGEFDHQACWKRWILNHYHVVCLFQLALHRAEQVRTKPPIHHFCMRLRCG